MLALVLAAALAAVHLTAGKLRVLPEVPRSAALSAAGGVSIAYVVVHLLPEVATASTEIAERGLLPAIERHAWVLTLVGLLLFHAVEVHAQRARRGRRADGRTDRTPRGVAWLHLGAFAVLNVTIGHVLVDGDRSLTGTLLYALAMALHLVVNDHGLLHHHGDRYDRVGRVVLAAAVLAGAVLATTVPIDPTAIGALVAFLAGGVVLNVVKEELPRDRDSRLGPLLGAAAAYAAVLLVSGG